MAYEGKASIPQGTNLEEYHGTGGNGIPQGTNLEEQHGT